VRKLARCIRSVGYGDADDPASMVGATLLMALACSMYVIAMVLGCVEGVS